MDKQLEEALQIRYVKLYFTISFLEDSVLPVHKASALRGGMGEMLLRANCIRDRKCKTCDFETECIVRRTMYSKFDIKPDYVTNGESIGYVLECEDSRTQFPKNKTMEFSLLLFGRTIVYFNQFLQAFYALGMNGIGAGYAKFIITSVKNTFRQDLLIENNVLMKNYEVDTISHYVKSRLKKIEHTEGWLIFQTPLTLKYNGEFLQEFRPDAILSSIKRRIHMLDYFEGIQNDFYHNYQVPVPEAAMQQHQYVKIRRYSSRQEGHMYLKGITGVIQMKIHEDTLPLLLAGELMHIGKNTSFGFGRYKIV